MEEDLTAEVAGLAGKILATTQEGFDLVERLGGQPRTQTQIGSGIFEQPATA